MSIPSVNFLELTELAGDEVSQEQVERLYQRYVWAAGYCQGKRVLEAACGTGQGLGLLGQHAQSLVGGDYEPKMLEMARKHYGDRFKLQQMDAQQLPFSDQSLDVVVLFEAIYYLPSADKFVAECKRVLTPGGKVLIATANKDLFDFNPSPHSFVYYGVVELEQLFAKYGFKSDFFATTPITEVSLKQKILRPVKKAVVSLGLMPKSMAGKKLLKKLVFGGLVPMPAEVLPNSVNAAVPLAIDSTQANKTHKVILCCATKI